MDNSFSQDRDFFALLRFGLWGKTDCALSAGTDWEHIANLAKEHRVQGIIAEGISVMGVSDGIPEGILNRLAVDKVYIAMRNKQVNRVQAKLCGALESEGIQYAVLKGQPVAQSYAKPETRRSGDIDFLVMERDFDRVNELFSRYTEEPQHSIPFDLHHELRIDEVSVETHAAARSYFTRRLDRVLDNEVRRMFLESDFDHYICDGQTVSVPNPEYTTLFLMGHILRHISTDGIVLKQLCDWVMYIHSQRDRIDRAKFEKMLAESRIRKTWKCFSAFAVEWMGLEPGFPLLFNSAQSVYGNGVWRTITGVRKIKNRSKERHISNFWMHYLDDYRKYISKNRFLWEFSKVAYFERLWNKFSALPVEYFKRLFRVNGVGFKKDRFK